MEQPYSDDENSYNNNENSDNDSDADGYLGVDDISGNNSEENEGADDDDDGYGEYDPNSEQIQFKEEKKPIIVILENKTPKEPKILQNLNFLDTSPSTNWNEEFQALVDEAYFKKREEISVEDRYRISIKLKKLCVEFAEEGAKIGVQIVKEMVFIISFCFIIDYVDVNMIF